MTDGTPTHRMHQYLLHGYRLVTDIAVPGYPAADEPASRTDDVLRIRSRPNRAPAPDLDDGDVLAELADPQRRQVYRFTRSAQRLLLRFVGTADVVTDARLRHGEAWAWPGADPDVLSVLLPGTVLAARLILDGHLVLHASAFDVDGSAVAVVGRSGMGKSTLGTLAVLAGRSLVSDDVLRVDLDDDRALAWPGGAETRLRPSTREAVPRFAAAGTVRTTADLRTAVSLAALSRSAVSRSGSPGGDDHRRLPLRCVVVPFPRRDVGRVTVRRLDPFSAMRRLSQCPRVVGWCDRATTAHQFDLLADLCQLVPVVEATLPWGPPFDSGLVDALVDALPGG